MGRLRQYALVLLSFALAAPAVAQAKDRGCICYHAFECRQACHRPLARRGAEACIEPYCAKHLPLATRYPEECICPRCAHHKPLRPCYPQPCDDQRGCD